MATEYEKKVLKKFIQWRYVKTEEEKEIIEEFASIGFVSCGYNWDEEKQTAKLTELGRRCLSM